MPGKERCDRDDGISVIIGTLLLILITVTAAAGLAVMVSQMQKDEMNRQTHQAQVKNEELKFTGIDLVYDVNTSTWSEANITVLNLNIDDSSIIALGLNNRYASSVTDYTDGLKISYDLLNKERLQIDGTKQKVIGVNFSTDFASPQAIGVSEPITVRVMTSLFNNFEHTFIPPTAMFKMSVESEDLGVTQRDVIVVDGSESYDDGTIMKWNWSVFGNSTGYIEYYSGKAARISPNGKGPFWINLTVTDDTGMSGISKSIEIPATIKTNPPAYLTAIHIPDPYGGSNGTLTATVTGIDMTGIPGELVTFTVDPKDNLTLSATRNFTNAAGQVSINYLYNGSDENWVITAHSGKLPPYDVIVP